MDAEEGKAMTGSDKDSDERLGAVLSRIDDVPPPKPSRLTGLLGFLNPRRWHPAVALSLVVAVGAQASVIGGLSLTNRNNGAQIASLNKQVGDLQFALASGPGAARSGNIVLQLRPEAGWAAVEALLGSEGLAIVGGPSDGAITLASAAKGAALDAQLMRLRASPLIAAADKAA